MFTVFCDLNDAVVRGMLPSEPAIVAVGGLPITLDASTPQQHTLMGVPVTAESIRVQLTRSLGLGAVLTFGNPKHRSLIELGNLCLDHCHLWTYHVLSLTILFHGAPLDVRNAFAFDGRFHLSWVDREVSTPTTTFTAAGSLKQWIRIGEKRNDTSFSAVQREWFAKAQMLLDSVLP